MTSDSEGDRVTTSSWHVSSADQGADREEGLAPGIKEKIGQSARMMDQYPMGGHGSA